MKDKWYYIKLISNMAIIDNYYNYLLEMMDEYGKNNTREITCEEAKAFYLKIANSPSRKRYILVW